MKITCDRQLTDIDRIVAATEAFFADQGIDSSIRYAVDLVTEELFVNLVNYNTGTDAQIEIEMSTRDGGIQVCLTDFDVDRFDPTAHGKVDVRAPLEDRTPGGLGIYLVLNLVDTISYDYKDRVSRITFTKNREPVDNV